LLGGAPQPFQSLGLLAVLEQQQAERGLGIKMATRRRALEPGLGRGKVDRDPPPKAVRLPQVELGIGVSAFRERPPDCDRRCIIGALPRFDSRLDRLRRKRRGHYGKQCRGN
jgi:hypothetical protein